jgi:hypothetical protein
LDDEAFGQNGFRTKWFSDKMVFGQNGFSDKMVFRTKWFFGQNGFSDKMVFGQNGFSDKCLYFHLIFACVCVSKMLTLISQVRKKVKASVRLSNHSELTSAGTDIVKPSGSIR